MRFAHTRSIAPAILLGVLLGFTCPSALTAGWKTGVARVCITPQQSMWMAGYAARSKPATGKLNDLWVRALVLDDGRENQAVIISLDILGIGRNLAMSVCEELKSHYGFERHQIALCCSHTHSGPVIGDNLEPLHYAQLNTVHQKLVDQYAASLIQRIVECVGQAVTDIEPSELDFASGNCSFAVNRRNNREADVAQLRDSDSLKGPVDHDVPVLAVRNSDGKLKAVAFGYACHATVLDGYQWSGDYPGYAQDELESAHPGTIAMFWAGCGADQNPLPRRRVELAEQYGKQLAVSVEAVLGQSMSPVKETLSTRFEEIDLPLGTLPTIEQLTAEAKSENKYYSARARRLLDQIQAGKPLAKTYPYAVGVWKLGNEVQFVFLGGEVVVDYAIRIKGELSGSRTWVAGYANDVMAYIPSRRVLREGGYEGSGAMVYYGLPTAWSPEVENLIVETVRRLMKEGKAEGEKRRGAEGEK
jgi:neutral ceramidase